MNMRNEWDFENADTQYLTHNFHPFAARFIPQIPSKLIENFSNPKELVLDPFVGCGTTLVECKLKGRHGVGIDINPLFEIISKAKTTPLSDKKLKRLKPWQAGLIQGIKSLYGQTTLFKQNASIKLFDKPSWKNIDHWFSKDVQMELAAIKNQIDILDDTELTDFLLTCLSSIIIRVSYQDSETRYARKERSIEHLDVLNAFIQKMDDMIIRIGDFSKVCSNSKIKVFTHDARQLDFLRDKSFHLIITSPPYMNAYDYHKYHRQRMLWLGFDPSPVRRAEIGGHDTFTKTGANPEIYFKDMRNCMNEMFRVLKPGRHCFIVIGDSIVGGKKIRSQDRLAEIGRDIGFIDINLIERNVNKAKKLFIYGARLEQEYIVCMKKP